MNYQKLFLIIIQLVNFSFAQVPVDSTFPAPGQMVDIGGRKLHLLCSGKGNPTIILIAGGGAYAIDWALVQNSIDSETRVCSYDRAGLGWSDAGPENETVEQTVDDLHLLLHKAGEKGPFILVGASVAGIYIQAYQLKFPNEVAGLVFTNSANRIGFKTKDTAGLIWDLTEVQIRSAYPMSAASKGDPPDHIWGPFDRLPKNLQMMRISLQMKDWNSWDPEKATANSLLSWRKEFIREFELTEFGKPPPLGKLPVIVVSSSGMANDSSRKSRDVAAARLDFLSTNSLHITATGSGHEIHLYQPEKVIEALKKMLVAVRTKKPL